jgi:hypothetical protein
LVFVVLGFSRHLASARFGPKQKARCRPEGWRYEGKSKVTDEVARQSCEDGRNASRNLPRISLPYDLMQI